MLPNLKRPLTLIIFTVFLLFILGACTNEGKDHSGGGHSDKKAEDNIDHENMDMGANEENSSFEGNLVTLNTKNITRIPTKDPILTSIHVSQMIWPATHKENQPGTVILIPMDNWQIGLASANLIHHPNDGPMLYVKKDSISTEVLNEIKRLNPKGNINGTQIMIMGDITDNVAKELDGYQIEFITGKSPAEFAKNVDDVYAEITKAYTDSVIIVSADEKDKLYSIPAVNWIAHMPEPILYVSEKGIPAETIASLEKRQGNATIYLLGTEEVISSDLEGKLAEYGEVKRIAGTDAVSTSIEFAMYKDENTKFGWGLNEPGHGLSFVSTATPELAIVAAPFSHLGKHAPLIWIDNQELTKETSEFLELIKPTFEDDPTVGPYNHGYMIGDLSLIPFNLQGLMDSKLEISPEHGDGHSGH